MFFLLLHARTDVQTQVVRRRLRKAGSDRGDRFDENGELEAEDLVLNCR